MTIREIIIDTNDINDLLSLYANCKGLKYWYARKLIERKIYSIEIPKIKNQLVSKKKFQKRLNSPMVVLGKNGLPNFFSSKHDQKNQKRKVEKLYNALYKNKPYFMITKIIANMDLRNKQFFEYVSGANLTIFKKLQNLKKSL